MSNKPFNEFETTSGLPLADAEVTITAFEFGYNNDINPGAVFANITFVDADGEDHEQSFSVGTGWESANKGAELVSENGKPKKFSSGSNFGRLIDSAVATVGMDKIGDILPFGPRVAASWLGTKWHTTTVKVQVSKPGSQEKIERDRIVFDQYLGREGEAPAAGKPGAGKTDTLGLDQEQYDQLLQVAKDAEDHDKFMDVALELPFVQGNKPVEKAVMQSAGKTSIWSAAGR